MSGPPKETSKPTQRRLPAGGSSPGAAPRPLRREDVPTGIAADGSQWVWPFKLTTRLGEGGMGVVYRGEYAVNGREVAVKMLPADVTDPVIMRRFEQELEILRDLKHPNIVRCFGGVCENDRRFYAMELVEGGTLEEELTARTRLPWEQVVEYGLEMAAALQASHEKGIVHRDVKPGNFLKTKTGRLKLSDFGLARIDAGRKITRAGKTAGTVLYMAPEQIRGKEVTSAADLYALGCVLYEMLAGRTPFDGESSAAILHSHVLNPPPRLGQFATDCPPALEELIHQLLEKAPEDRPSNAAEVGVRLGNLSQTVSVRRSIGEGRVSSVPVSTPRSSPEDETQTLEASTLSPAKRSPAVGRGPLIALLVLTALSVASAAWFGARSAELRRFKDAWLTAAKRPGPIQAEAIGVLGTLGGSDEDAYQAILSALDSTDPLIRAAAAEAGGELGRGDMGLVGRLQRMAKSDDDSAVRSAATRAVSAIRDRN